MRIREVTIAVALAMLASAGAVAAGGCQRRNASPAGSGSTGSGSTGTGSGSGGGGRGATTVAAGTTCGGRDDCTSDQVCIQQACRYRATSVAGEILLAAAAAQMEDGDLGGATRTFDQAAAAYEAASAPVPPDVLCGAAAAALRSATSAETREEAVKRADHCFRSSLPGDPTRAEVARALARLRYDGLDIDRFDRGGTGDRFFTKQPSRPTSDQIEIAVDVTERDHAGYAALAEALRGERARGVIRDCFIQHWELRHERSVQASLVLKFQTRMRDMGDYDVFDPQVEVMQTSLAQEGFENCLANNLPESLRPGPRVSRAVEWQEPFSVAAQLQ